MPDFLAKLKTKIRNYHERTSWLVIVFLTVFAASSWIDINGLWVELPIMVHQLPEGWRLPSVLVLMTQIAQIGTIIFLLLKWFCPKRISYVMTIYFILVIAAISCLLLCFFWTKTTKIGSEERSIGLYILTFSLSIIDGMSTVVYLAYIGSTFKKEYIISSYLGESLSAMVPGVAGMIQGVGNNLGCRNISVVKGNDTVKQVYELEPIPLVPTFSVSIYFLFLFASICLSLLTFSLAEYLPLSQKAKRKTIESSATVYPLEAISNVESKKPTESDDTNRIAVQIPSKIEQVIMQNITAGCTCLMYGVLPSLQSYSTLPYGNDVFHLSITLCLFLLPFSTFLSTWSNNLSTLRISIEFLIGASFATYIIVISTQSPCPVLFDSKMGPALILISWMACQMLFMRIRYCVSARLEICGERSLLLIGTYAVAGQVIGGVLMYILIDVYRLFNDVPSCVTIRDYCST